ncbi:MAG: histidine kinase [Lewinellaceae bacterium]|nr:histidine kinase [Lewinellaceae bacterium]
MCNYHNAPWWQTWWAYLLYAATFIFSITAYVRYRSRKLLQENIILEAKVRQRTLESEQKSRDLEKSLEHLQSTQTQLIQSEKLASLGELTAGIAHEIQNPLNFVNNFSELSVDLAKDIKEEMHKPAVDKAYLDEFLNDLDQNQEKINLHGKRAAAIVSGMLQHARTSTGKKEPTDLNALADEYLRLSYHGLRAKDSNFNAKMVTDFDPAVGKVDVIPQDMGRVLLNLINNAFYAVQQRERQLPESLKLSGSSPNTAPELPGSPDFPGFKNLESLSAPYQPTVTISTQQTDNQIIIKIKDNGTGIPDDVKAKIFQPFFTTKPTGQGTGLGLSLAYDIITKGHGGTMEVESVAGEGTEFVVKLPDK